MEPANQHKCKWCQESFGTKFHLAKHMKTCEYRGTVKKVVVAENKKKLSIEQQLKSDSEAYFDKFNKLLQLNPEQVRDYVNAIRVDGAVPPHFDCYICK